MSEKTNVLVHSGGTAGIAAALLLKRKGLNVTILTDRSYLGEDVCDPLRLILPPSIDLSDPLARALYGEAAASGRGVRPMEIKGKLDRVCREAGIPVFFSSYLESIDLRSGGSGVEVLVGGRAGRFGILCDAVIDSSLRGGFIRAAGFRLRAPATEFLVERRVIGGQDLPGWELEGHVSLGAETGSVPLFLMRRRECVPDGSWESWMALEGRMRLVAYRPGQKMSADGIFAITGERLGETGHEFFGRPEDLPPESCACCGGKVWVTGPLACAAPGTNEAIVRHDTAIAHGLRIATWVLENAGSSAGGFPLEAGTRPRKEVDVLVVGGGTGGAPAGIAAARGGSRSLVVEALSGLGGVGTLGLIGRYWFGCRFGFTAEVDAGAASLTPEVLPTDDWNIEAKMQWYHRSITEAGGTVWYKCALGGVHRDGKRVTGATILTPQGPVEVRFRVVVDASGSADVTAAAGGRTVAVGDGHLAMQGTGLPGRTPGQNYANTDYEFIDDTVGRDVSSAHVAAREKFEGAFDAGQLIDSRERRRIVGDYEVTPMDIRLRRVFPDCIAMACSNFDTHGFTVHPLFLIVPPDHDPREAFIPLSALLPAGLEGVITTGLGICAHRDAMPVIRMQADVQNQGYAAGVIASMAALETGGDIRGLPIKKLQSRLVDLGILPEEAAGGRDSFPLPPEEIERCLTASVENVEWIDRVFTLPREESLVLLRRALASASTLRARRHFAFVLAVLENATGWEVLAEEVREASWDKGWNYRGMGQFGASLSPLDARIIALGRCRQPGALGVLLDKAATLPDDAEFSHYRALAEALGVLGLAEGAPALERLLARPGVTGHAIRDEKARVATAGCSATETRFRNAALIELHLATALLRLKVESRQARAVLESYAEDVRGLFSRHARLVLEEATKTPAAPHTSD